MSLFYKPIQATIPDKDGNKKWHIALVKTGKIIDIQDMSDEAAYSTTLTPADMHAAIRSLFRVVRKELLNSNSVRLDGLGTLTMYARSQGKGVDDPEKVSPDQITSLRVHFTPEYTRVAGVGTTRAILQGVDFVRADKINTGAWGEATGNNGNDDGDDDGGYVDPTT